MQNPTHKGRRQKSVASHQFKCFAPTKHALHVCDSELPPPCSFLIRVCVCLQICALEAIARSRARGEIAVFVSVPNLDGKVHIRSEGDVFVFCVGLRMLDNLWISVQQYVAVFVYRREPILVLDHSD